MSLYYEAAAILANPENVGGSLVSRIFKKKDLKSSPGQVFALVAEASKWSLVLKDVIEKCRLLSEERKLTPILALLLTHDLLLAKSGVAAPATHVLKLAVTRHKARLSAEFTKARIRYGHATLDAFREAVNNGELDVQDSATHKTIRHPRWVRINAIKTTLEQQLSTTFAGFSEVEHLSEVLSASRGSKIYFKDPNIPNLLALPSKVDLGRSSAYTSGHIIFQDKASCFPAYLLDLSSDDGDVIDGCAAPGNKTTHLAAIISSQKSRQGQKVIAFERDKVRTGTLQKMVKLASADKIVTVKGSSDFIAAKPGSDEFANVGAILLDPSCSGTGIVGRDDALKMHLPAPHAGAEVAQKTGKNKKRKRGDEADPTSQSTAVLNLDLDDSTPEETLIDGKLSERLTALSKFQLHILNHAMRFEGARKITYSTCSIHFEENEGVVFQALASTVARERGWKVLKREHQVEGMKKWNVRGVWEEEKLSGSVVDEETKKNVLEACIRCDKGTEEGTMGFFVAALVRDDGAASKESTEAVSSKYEDWAGFSDDEAAQEVVSASVPAENELKERKKKKRKGAK